MLVRQAVADAIADGDLAVEPPADVTVERPRNRDHGDYASNVALVLAKAAKRPPRDVAQLLATRLTAAAGIEAVEVAGPGFLNVRLAADALGETARRIIEAGGSYGTNTAAAGLQVNLEFVSGNPTGPVHIGGLRWAAVGDAIARLLIASGAHVTREYYINDAGVQVARFGASLLAAAHGEPAPEDGYAGAYVADVAATVLAGHTGLLQLPREEQLIVFTELGLQTMIAEIRESLARFGVHYDVWFSERSLETSGALQRALDRLTEQGRTYDKDGATWLRTTDFGDDKDRVLVKSDGETTYFASDAAYYLDKRSRGAEKVVIMLGADHHGYIGRMRAMVACFGDDPDVTLELPIGQLVDVVRDGQPVKMSKRAGTFVTLDDLVEMTGVDAARYTLARSSTDSPMTLDVDLVTRRTNDNPVFYVQMAHARIASIVRNAQEYGIPAPWRTGGSAADLDAVPVGLLDHPAEVALLGHLAEFPRVVGSAAELRAPHRVARYLEDLAGTFHRFYEACRVLPKGDEPLEPVNGARLLLCEASRVVLANGLRLLGVTAPERM
ncbi:MAG: arginyl-tRNA synthetase [Mycobacterium sp.]|nr:arginyl-tRNA synthetase [Mycobacterium sp.]